MVKVCKFYNVVVGTKYGNLLILQRKANVLGTHIDKICSDAKKYCSWIFRTFSARDKTTLLTLWKAIVQPRLLFSTLVAP